MDHENEVPNGEDDIDSDQFRRLVDSIEDYAIIILDKEGRVCSWNKGAVHINGYSKSEIIGKNFSVFYSREAAENKVPLLELEDARINGIHAEEDWRFRKDGSRFWANIVLTALYDQSGNLQGYTKITKDMTERKRLEERFRQVVESAPNAMIMINSLGRIEMVNRQTEKLFHYTRIELVGQLVEILVPERFRHDHPKKRGSFFGEPVSRPMGAGRDLFGRRKDGSEFPVEIGLNPIETDDGLMVLSSIVDISERKRLEERFRRVVESAPNAMVMINERGRIEMVNTQTERLFGYARSEMLGNLVEILVPERFRHGHPEKRGSFFGEPNSRPMGAGRDLFGRRKNGSEFPVEIGLNPIETEDGLMVLSSIVDISERKRLEERFRRVVESAPNAMVMINEHGRIEMVNAQAERLFEYSRSEMLGNLVEMLVPERFRTGHPEKRTMFFGDPHSRPMGAGRDLFGRRKNGSEFPVEIGLNPIDTEEGVMVLSSIVDISDRRQKEEKIQAALKEKDLLLGEIHHRVKNNLQVIHSLLNLQSSLISDATVKGMLMDSQNRIQSMALIHQTLYQSNDFASVDFSGFLDALIPTLVTSYGVSDQKIEVTINAGSVSLPINSAIPCGLLINELITNALKHAFPNNTNGEITVTFSRLKGNRVLLIIADDGVGIPDALDINNVESLGLRLVSLLSQQLEGTLAIHRRDPTRFTIEFPVVFS